VEDQKNYQEQQMSFRAAADLNRFHGYWYCFKVVTTSSKKFFFKGLLVYATKKEYW
jgi:hypothetical protein